MGNSRTEEALFFLLRKTHDKLFLASAAKLSRKSMRRDDVHWCHVDILHPVDRIWILAFPTFSVIGNRSASDQFFTWKTSLKKVTLPLSSPLLLIFHPSSLSWTSITTKCTARLEGFFFRLLRFIYCMNPSSSKSQMKENDWEHFVLLLVYRGRVCNDT